MKGVHHRREALLAGNLTHVDATDWPVPGTRWQRLYLDPSHTGTALSLNDIMTRCRRDWNEMPLRSRK